MGRRREAGLRQMDNTVVSYRAHPQPWEWTQISLAIFIGWKEKQMRI